MTDILVTNSDLCVYCEIEKQTEAELNAVDYGYYELLL